MGKPHESLLGRAMHGASPLVLPKLDRPDSYRSGTDSKILNFDMGRITTRLKMQMPPYVELPVRVAKQQLAVTGDTRTCK